MLNVPKLIIFLLIVHLILIEVFVNSIVNCITASATLTQLLDNVAARLRGL